METYGQRLRRLRGTRSRKDFAKAIGVTTQSLNAYEKGRREPRDEVKLRIAGLLLGQDDSFFTEEVHN